jgi:hypothetical protein
MSRDAAVPNGAALRAAIARATSLTNPRLSEVEWDYVAFELIDWYPPAAYLARAALERLVRWHNTPPLEGPGPTTAEVDEHWARWSLEETEAFEQARAALAIEEHHHLFRPVGDVKVCVCGLTVNEWSAALAKERGE